MSKKALIAMVLFSLILIISSLYIINMLDPGEKAKTMWLKIGFSWFYRISIRRHWVPTGCAFSFDCGIFRPKRGFSFLGCT